MVPYLLPPVSSNIGVSGFYFFGGLIEEKRFVHSKLSAFSHYSIIFPTMFFYIEKQFTYWLSIIPHESLKMTVVAWADFCSTIFPYVAWRR
jgi:hypothetical protein